ncbi:hypothetical protein MVES1_002094 [Malassezia vespertilionis]|uniref:RRM domain-containing protein n=1 Tax=Malassezia vespertilionis TaxID=2020962 RepID=A0A2N1JC88_9BASI|nr:uncharacterized protein MVES1_002094 [Malassezia vespertilionis]PKI84142.1 hypothetical protein MVES_001979 [Malassezia vespertilionis]WFD06740.1 hypothetical protein MVES1_002094 [Malassezia vespertilionis]
MSEYSDSVSGSSHSPKSVTAAYPMCSALAAPCYANPNLAIPSNGGAEMRALPSPPFPRQKRPSVEYASMHEIQGICAAPRLPSNQGALGSQGSAGPRTTFSTATAAASDRRTQLCVRNLPYSVRWQDVKDLFRRAGTVLRADVRLVDNRSCGTGTVLFATEADALRARDTLHGYNWQGRVLDVQLERDMMPMPAESDEKRVAHMQSLPGLETLPLPPTRVRRSSLHVQPLRTDEWNAPGNAAQPGGAPMPFPGRVLFIGNLPFHCQWQDLKDLFRAAGNIQRADVALNADGRSRGFGTVLFASPEDAQNAVRLYHGYEYNGRILKVHFDRLANFAATPGVVPTDPSQYTAAFSTSVHAQGPPERNHSVPAMGHLNSGSVWGAPFPMDRDAATQSFAPGRISLPQLSFPGQGAFGASLTPGMPGFTMRTVFDTPPLYPQAMSPGHSPFIPDTSVPPDYPSFMNPAPGAPLGYMPPLSFGAQDLAGFAHSSALPSTPHWSQPMRSHAAQHAKASDEPLHATPRPPNQGTGDEHGTGEYPFPVVGNAASRGASPTPHDGGEAVRPAGAQQNTKELMDAIAKLSVSGTARAKQSSRGASDSRTAAEQALCRLRENLSSMDGKKDATED